VRETAADTVTSTIGGEWEIRIFHDQPEGSEHLALVKGDLEADGPVLVRMHVLDPFDDVLALHPDRFEQVPDSMAAIAAEGRGALVLLRDMSPGALSAKLRAAGPSPRQLRQYGVGAQILHALGIRELVLLTNSPAPRVVGLEGYGISIVGTRPIPKRGG
jgi:3,4-dihydroxy 2-butanone 4-phosphate synthase/GTP cyclohydrolase II